LDSGNAGANLEPGSEDGDRHPAHPDQFKKRDRRARHSPIAISGDRLAKERSSIITGFCWVKNNTRCSSLHPKISKSGQFSIFFNGSTSVQPLKIDDGEEHLTSI
jgi:hypothetical protein